MLGQCDIYPGWHNNRTSSENPQNIIGHITSKCLVLHRQSIVFGSKLLYMYIYIYIYIKLTPLEFYLKLVLPSFTVIFCFSFEILYRPFSYYIKIDICIFLLKNGALCDICLMHCGICETGLSKTVRRYASVNMEFISIIHVYLSQRLQIFCHVYIYIFKKQNKSKKRTWYVLASMHSIAKW